MTRCVCEYFYHNLQDHDIGCPVVDGLSDCGIQGCVTCYSRDKEKLTDDFSGIREGYREAQTNLP